MNKIAVPSYTLVDRPLTWKQAKRQFEASYVTELLEITKGNVQMASLLAGKDRKDFYDLMRRAGVDPNDFRDKPWRRRA